MSSKDIEAGDVVFIVWGSSVKYKDYTPVIHKFVKETATLTKYLVVCPNGLIGTESSFDLDEDYLERFSLPKKWLGWEVAIFKNEQVVSRTYRPQKVGDRVRLSCVVDDGVIRKITPPNLKGTVVREFEIIGRFFNRSAWQYEYAVRLPDNSTTGIILSLEDVKNWEMNPVLEGKLFQGVLVSEIVSVVESSRPQGMNCMNPYCRVFCDWVDQSNCPNEIFLCYGCRHNPITYAVVMDQYASVV